MTARTFADGSRWVAQGTRLFVAAVDGLGLDEEMFAEPSLLPGWTRKHLVAHVAANADALGNLVRWAATGVRTPMYSSPEDRANGIARGATMAATELDAWLRTSAANLAAAMDRLGPSQWQQEVVTAQGRTVPATEIPWMRAREVCVHAVDLGRGLAFADLPAGFNAALRADIQAKRGLAELPASVAGADPAQATAWLAGRAHTLTEAPDLGAWL